MVPRRRAGHGSESIVLRKRKCPKGRNSQLPSPWKKMTRSRFWAYRWNIMHGLLGQHVQKRAIWIQSIKYDESQKILLQSSTSMVYKKSFLNIPVLLAAGFELCRGNFLYKMLWFLDVDIRSFFSRK